MGPFEGIRVIDLSRVLAGPYCAQLLADYGAQVIKVEEPSGDELRTWFPKAGDTSTNFIAVNRGKRDLTLNLKSEAGRQLLLKLVKSSDVLIHSFLSPVASRLGVDYESLKAVNPDLIYCSISGYGGQGDMRDDPGYDLMMQAFTGVMMLTGEPDGPPMRAGLSTIDLSTSMLAFGGISAALLARARGKAKGQHVQVSLMETGVALLGYHVTNYMNAGFAGSRAGSGVGHIVPYQAWQCCDGWLLAGATNDKGWLRFAEAIDAPELAADARFETTLMRRENRDVLLPLIEARMAANSVDHWLGRLRAAGVPASAVHTIDQVVAHPQVLANGMVVSTADARGEPIHMIGPPIKMSETPPCVSGRPPELGEHTVQILSDDLGLSQVEIDRLRTEGVI